MVKKDVARMLEIVKVAYPRFYKDMPQQEVAQTVELWSTMFANEDGALVLATVKELINSFEYPPTIADVKNKMKSITGQADEDIMKYWHEFKKAVSNGLYEGKYIEFEKASDPLKQFLGNANQLEEYAMMDSATFNTVTKGQFLKQMEVILARKQEQRNMLPETKALISTLANKLSLTNSLE